VTTIDAPSDDRTAPAADRNQADHRDTRDTPGGAATVSKALAILEIVADREGASAREVAAALDIPLSTAYRLAQHLVNADYLVHLKDERRYELGFKLHQLGLSLHRQMGVAPEVRAQVRALHRQADAAAYFAQYRGSEVVVACVADSPARPRVTPLDFGFHEATHATAFGKIMLAGMMPEQRDQFLSGHPLTPLTRHTLTDRADLETHLATVGRAGVAWEHEEFMPDLVCVAAGVRGPDGTIVGSIAVSGSVIQMRRRAAACESSVRHSAAELSRYFRSGPDRPPSDRQGGPLST
jgi:DNA-binding IclR family transcriptional regulator